MYTMHSHAGYTSLSPSVRYLMVKEHDEDDAVNKTILNFGPHIMLSPPPFVLH